MPIRWVMPVFAFLVLAIPALAQGKKSLIAIDSPDAVKILQRELHLSAASVANPVDAAFIRRTRIDSIGYKDADKKEIEIKGVRLDYSGIAMMKDSWNDAVHPRLADILRKHIQTEAEAKLPLDLTKGFTTIDLPDQPHILLQGVANKKGLDEVLLVSSSFTADGELRLDGLVGKTTRPELEKAIRAELDGKPIVRAKSANADRITFSGIKEAEWSLGQSALQAWLANQSKEGLDQFRIDRVEYSYQPLGEKSDKNVKLIAKIKLVELTGDAKSDISVQEKFSDQILGKNWDAFTKPLSTLPAAERKEPTIDNPERATFAYASERTKLQTAVADRNDLDGTLVWGKARFNSAGKLEMNGVWRGDAKAADALETRLKEVLSRQNDRLVAGGVSAAKFAVVNTQAVFVELADWAGATLDDVRVERLSFDATGKLILKATAASKDDAAKLEAQFRALLARHEILKKLDESRSAVASADPPAEKAPPSEAGTNIATFSGSLTTDLQTYLASHAGEPKWRGILIGRGYFDRRQGNRYSLSVILDESKQAAAVTELVKEFAAKPTYAGYLGKDENPILSVEVISLGKLVAELREVMPAYPLFDGFRVDNAIHDAQRNLVLIVAGVSTPANLEPKPNEKDPIGQVRQSLKKMLDDHPLWRKRSAVRVDSRLVFVYPTAIGMNGPVPGGPVPFNYDLGPLTAIHAARAIITDRGQKDDTYSGPYMRYQMRTALMHNPNNSALWYLSAGFHVIDGREDLALRDLRRVVLLEKEPEIDDFAVEIKKARIPVLEPFQGTVRHRVETLLDKAFLDYNANKPAMGLKANP